MGWTCPAIFFRTKRMDSLLVVGILRMTYLKRIKVNNHFKTCFHNHAILHLISTLSTIETIMYTYIYIYMFPVRGSLPPPPRGREKLGLFRVLPKTPFSSQMLKVLSQLHHHHHHLFLSHPCNPSQTFHDSFISTSQPSCSCMIPPWVLIFFPSRSPPC